MVVKIDRNPEVQARVWILERQETFEGYYKTYGDEIAERYERGDVIVIPYMPIIADLEFLQKTTLNAALKKIGTAEGLDRDLMIRNGDQLVWNPNHFFVGEQGPSPELMYLYQQIVHVNQQIRIGLHKLFPRYLGMTESNMTWRFTPCENEVMHYDGYTNLPKDTRIDNLRLKFFINFDSEPRVWQLTHNLPHILKTCFDPRLEPMPRTINDITVRIGETDILFDKPTHRLEWPALAGVFANGDVVAHELVYGRRAVGGDFQIPPEEMLHPELQAETLLPSWLSERDNQRKAVG